MYREDTYERGQSVQSQVCLYSFGISTEDKELDDLPSLYRIPKLHKCPYT